ncbi:MAG TPA: hypothetical protein VMW24_28010 [Sedimentisphaerales bacterium]|nr:hypothetical protein [Sedimentisphaerales bacterium]
MATSEFGKAFAAAYKELGPGKTFPFKGKIYSTDMASDKKASSAPKKAPVPKERPSMPKRKPSEGSPEGYNSKLSTLKTFGGLLSESPSKDRSKTTNPRAGNRSGVKVKPSESKKPSDLKGRNAKRVSRSMDDTPKPKRSGNPRAGNRSGVKMK